VENPDKADEFSQRYRPVRVGVTNTMDRRRDPDTAPLFQTAVDGDYYAVELEGSAFYAIVPRFGLVYQRSIHGPGAMGLVFDCSDYDPNLRYRNVKVLRPALFTPDVARQRWAFKEKGELDLEEGNQSE